MSAETPTAATLNAANAAALDEIATLRTRLAACERDRDAAQSRASALAADIVEVHERARIMERESDEAIVRMHAAVRDADTARADLRIAVEQIAQQGTAMVGFLRDRDAANEARAAASADALEQTALAARVCGERDALKAEVAAERAARERAERERDAALARLAEVEAERETIRAAVIACAYCNGVGSLLCLPCDVIEPCPACGGLRAALAATQEPDRG